MKNYLSLRLAYYVALWVLLYVNLPFLPYQDKIFSVLSYHPLGMSLSLQVILAAGAAAGTIAAYMRRFG